MRRLLLALPLLCLTATAWTQDDAGLARQVSDQISAAWGRSQPSGLIVVVEDGAVQLFGEAPSQAAAAQAERLARRVGGVREVTSHLTLIGSGDASPAPSPTPQPPPAAAGAPAGEPAGTAAAAPGPEEAPADG